MDPQAIAQFCAVTDTDERVAARALEAAGGKLELAITLFLDESHKHQPDALDHSDEDDPELAAAIQASLESAHSTLGDAASSAALGHSSPPVGWAEAGAAAEGSRCARAAQMRMMKVATSSSAESDVAGQLADVQRPMMLETAPSTSARSAPPPPLRMSQGIIDAIFSALPLGFSAGWGWLSGADLLSPSAVQIAGHDIAVVTTALDVSRWRLMAGHEVQEVTRALPLLLCLQELVLDGVLVSGSTTRSTAGAVRTVRRLRRSTAGAVRCRRPTFDDPTIVYRAPIVKTLNAHLDRLRALCEAVRACQALTSLSLKGCHLGPRALLLLGDLIRDGAAVKKLVLSHNFIFGSKDMGSWDNTEVHDIDADQTGWSALCGALPSSPLEELIVEDIGMGVTGVTSLAKAISAAGASIASLALDSNDIFGTFYAADKFVSEVQPFLDALKTSSITSLSLRGTGMGVKGVAAVGDAIRVMPSLALVNIAFNKIGGEGGAALVEALKNSSVKFLGIGKQFQSTDGTLITRSLVQTEVNLSLAGRVGEVIKIAPDLIRMKPGNYPDYIRMKWGDDGSTSEYININTMDGEPLNLPLQSNFEGSFLDLSHQQLDPGYVKILAWWLTNPFKASLTSCCLLHNPLGEGVKDIINVFQQTPRLRTLCGFEEGVENIDWSRSGK
eukprot:COSAG05_NODE_1634_length_4366_cov_44.638522_3_plen_670_part_01